MAISGIQVINIGLPNESTGSDSLYTAFNKTKTNFNTLFACSSPYNTFNSNTGITVTANANTGVVDILNTGVTSITTTANSGVVLSGNTGNIVITLVGGGGNGNGSGTVTSVGLVGGSSNARIAVTSNTTNPIVSNGTFTIDLTTTGVSAGTYTYPTVTVDAYGRVTSISNAASVGTVTSVGVTPGTGIQVTGSPVTTSGNITIVNTGVTRISAGTGISVSGSNGNVTISTSGLSGTVTSVALTSSTLTVSGSPITAAGTITVNLPSTISLAGNITGGNLITSGTLSVTGNANVGNLGTAGLITATGNVSGGNLTTGGVVVATGNISGNYFIGNGSQLTGLNGPAFVATQTIYQNLASSPSSISSLSLIYDNVVANTGTDYNSSTGIFTATKTGYYQISGSIGIDISGNTSANGSGALVMYHNGNAYAAGPFIQAFEAISGNVLTTVISQSLLSTLVYLNINDTVQLKLGYITNASSNQWTTETNIVPSSFQAVWLTP